MWIPVFVAYLVAVGIGGKHLNNPPPAVPATAADILSFASVIAGFVISYAPLSSDYTLYYTPDVPTYGFSRLPYVQSSLAFRCKVFTWTYIGLNVPVVCII